MYFEVSKISDVMNHVQNRAPKIGVTHSIDNLRFFGVIIDSIKENRKNNGKGLYRQGEDIDPEELKNIREAVQGFVEAEKERLLAKANDPKQPLKNIKNSAEYFATFADYYYVKAMQQLGCPNMPLFMFDNGFKKTIEDSAIAVHEAKTSYNDITTHNAYTHQRYVDADKLDKAFNPIFTNIDTNRHSPRDVGTLIAQYKALEMRQSNHGSVWRFFHQTENKARTDLLKKMDTYIKKALPTKLKNINLDQAIPAQVAREFANHNIKANVEYALTNRFANRTVEIYGCQAADEFMMEQYRFENVNEKVPLTNETNIINDVSIESSENVAQSEPVAGKSKDNIILEGLV